VDKFRVRRHAGVPGPALESWFGLSQREAATRS
jgi:hypothetical protein